MNIELKRNYGYELLIEADNVKISEDIEERIYPKREDGKIDFKAHPKRDIKTEAIEQIVNLLDDMIYYREANFDSSNLIEHLFDKLPNTQKALLLESLNKTYN